ncbi:MAG: DNA mismatch repair protein MutL, partial [Acutalibacteraceae bacterium]
VYAPNIFVTDEPVSAKAPVENGADSAAERGDESENAAAAENSRRVSFRYVGQAFDTYIIVECDKKLILIDKHAAHERILFERLKSVAAAEPQMLLSPLNVTLSAAEYDAVLTNLDRINEAGFDITDFGMNTVRVRSVPVYLDGEDVKGLIEEIAGKLINKNTDFTPEFLEWLFHNVACRAAIKAGNRSTEQELIALADTVLNDDKIRYCPHGRPVAAELSENEIKRRFSRI